MDRDYASQPFDTGQPAVNRSINSKMVVFIAVLVGLLALGLFLLRYHYNSLHKAPVVVSHPVPIKKKSAQPHVAVKPRFEFYSILPKRKVNAPAKLKESRKTVAQKALPGDIAYYRLQIGSFKNPYEADRLKAELTLLGFDVEVEAFKKSGKKWRRVTVGPYFSKRSANQAKWRLSKNHFPGIIRAVHTS